MKRNQKKVTIFLMALMLLILPFSVVHTAAAAESETANYTADFSSGLPSDWSGYDKSDLASGTVTGSDNGLKIKSSTSVAESKYYGSMYEIAVENGNYSNFEISMTFKMLSFVNDTRWIVA